ncbi:ATP/GTP-binding protein [Spirosoma sp. 209]|uniref:AAA family ATPase n=1 Tax=Spirosoma sp. 209 TaxID=1955701 RepID=UPI00098CF51A|nr:AAA family ATPase [Spirosoma sp. 209]
MENTSQESNNFLNWVEIKNFKSINDLRFDCKRVNVFIGKPNVGKSNILEGLGLLGAGYSVGKILNGFVRYRDIKQLYRDNDKRAKIEVVTDKQQIQINALPSLSAIGAQGTTSINKENYSIGGRDGISRIISASGAPSREISVGNEDHEERFQRYFRAVKKYDYGNLVDFTDSLETYLSPPNGSNLYSLVRSDNVLWAEFAKLFTEQQLELVLYDEKQEFILQKKNGPFVTQYPYFSIADTFRRFMFYITAIESNRNSILVFEEPEVHSFPPYVKAMAHRIVGSESNQFFVSTHSPYLLQTLISELDESELAVFITFYKDYQTQVRQLTVDELQEAQDLSIDLFYNLSRYEPNA